MAFLATWPHMGWVAATVLAVILAIVAGLLIAAVKVYMHPEAREKRAIRRRRRQRVKAMRVLQNSTAQTPVAFRDVRGIHR